MDDNATGLNIGDVVKVKQGVLDPDTEAGICESLAGLKGSVTILAISHQAALREVADVVYETSNGNIRLKRDLTAIHEG